MVISNDTTNGITPQASTTTTPPATTSTNPSDNLASEQTFLKLFVAQLQNQDPLNPNQQDPTQMVAELAQFSSLEQLVNIGSSVTSINTLLTNSQTATTPTTSAGATTPATTPTTGQTGATQSS
jgi:flagellar basal-body rod modification protein FlgD